MQLEFRVKNTGFDEDEKGELDLYEDGVARFNELSDAEFKKLIRKHYNYIKKIEK